MLNDERLQELLEAVRAGRVDIAAAHAEIAALGTRELNVGDLGFARIDHHRQVRCGFPEVVFGGGKRIKDLVRIAHEILDRSPRLLITRVGAETCAALVEEIDDARVHERAGVVTVEREGPLPRLGVSAIVSGGTADIPVAEEARVTAELMGSEVRTFYDCGVAGIHRTLEVTEEIRSAHVVIVVAGMEGALASVVAGLVSTPVIAVPTSIGYGASFNGLAALLTMLNSCAAGVTVVNVDNGFGAGYAAASILRLRESRSHEHESG